MSDIDYLSNSNNNHQYRLVVDQPIVSTSTTFESTENLRPCIPKYSTKDENLLRRVDLTSLESINSVFFPETYRKGRKYWIIVPKHILGIDTDFSFVSKKIEEYRKLGKTEQQRELTRWDKMQRWERNMYEDRVSILQQQRAIIESSSSSLSPSNASSGTSNVVGVLGDGGGGGGGILMNRVSINSNNNSNNSNKRNRDFAMTVMTTPTSTTETVLYNSNNSSASLVAIPSQVTTPRSSSRDVIANYSEIPDSKRRCIRMKPPIPSRYQGDIDADKEAAVPEFVTLMNFPSLTMPDNTRCCVMCGSACPTAAAVKSKKGIQRSGSKTNIEFAFIPTQNKGLCTLCDVNVWIIASTGMEIKWCKGCKNFRCWAAFGDKGHATKCMRCRERQREKYALQKEEKEKGFQSINNRASP